MLSDNVFLIKAYSILDSFFFFKKKKISQGFQKITKNLNKKI